MRLGSLGSIGCARLQFQTDLQPLYLFAAIKEHFKQTAYFEVADKVTYIGFGTTTTVTDLDKVSDGVALGYFEYPDMLQLPSSFLQYRHTLKYCNKTERYEVVGEYPNLSAITRTTKRQNHFSTQQIEHADLSENNFYDAYCKAKAYLGRGDIFQVVLSRRFTQTYRGDPFLVFQTLRQLSKTPYYYYIQNGSNVLFGASPEEHLTVSGDIATVSPIAGTTQVVNGVSSINLADDAKNISEHMMLVDLARNDLARHCYPVTALALAELKEYGKIQHLVSTLTGKIYPNSNLTELLQDITPAGTVSGAPKIRAMEIIAELEGSPRGYYGGCVGALDTRGETPELTTALLIRTASCIQNIISYRAGAGIVINSNFEDELQEINTKLAPIRSAIQLAGEQYASR